MRRRVALALGLPIAAAGALAAVVAAGGGGAPDGGGGADGAARHGTEVVERRTLVESERVDGTLGYGDPRPALDRLGGTLTWLPSAGAVVRAGQPLFAVDGRPVILMDGSVPAWRTLAAGRRGEDVRQLERNLAALGYDSGTVDDRFTAATTAAVKRWQDASGLHESGRVGLGRVVFLPSPRRIASVTGKLGATAGGTANASWDGGGAGPRMIETGYDPTAGAAATMPAEASPTTPATTPTTPATTPQTTPTQPHTTPTRPLTTPTTPSTTPTTPATAPTTPTTPGTTPTTPPRRSGDGDAPSGGSGDGDAPGDGDSPSGGSGDGNAPGDDDVPSGSGDGDAGSDGDAPSDGSGDGNPGGDGDAPSGGSGPAAASEVLKTTSTTRVVTAEIDAADQGLARVGGRAAVELPDGRRAGGRIVAVGTVATAAGDEQDPGAGGGDGEATVPVTIRLRAPRGAGRLDTAPVVVELARTTRRDVLAVPVAALIARSGGGYAIRIVRRGTTRTVEIPVDPGLFADGYVELTSGAVRAGDRVEVPR